MPDEAGTPPPAAQRPPRRRRVRTSATDVRCPTGPCVAAAEQLHPIASCREYAPTRRAQGQPHRSDRRAASGDVATTPPRPQPRMLSRPHVPPRRVNQRRARRAHTRRSADCRYRRRLVCSLIEALAKLYQATADPAFHGSERHLAACRQFVIRRSAEECFTNRTLLLRFQFIQALLQPPIFLAGFRVCCRGWLLVDGHIQILWVIQQFLSMLPQSVDRLIARQRHEPRDRVGPGGIEAGRASPYRSVGFLEYFLGFATVTQHA